MDRRIQRYLTIVFTLLINIGYAQCDKNMLVIVNDTLPGGKVCKKVVMSTYKWAYYFKAEQNLKAIEDSIPSLSRDIEKERAKTDSIEATSAKAIEIANEQKKLLKENYTDCLTTATTLEVKNISLQHSLNKEKRNNKWYFVGGVVGAGILRSGIKTLFGI